MLRDRRAFSLSLCLLNVVLQSAYNGDQGINPLDLLASIDTQIHYVIQVGYYYPSTFYSAK